MTDARDRAIDALCDTIYDLRKRIAHLEHTAIIKAPDPGKAYGIDAIEEIQRARDKARWRDPKFRPFAEQK